MSRMIPPSSRGLLNANNNKRSTNNTLRTAFISCVSIRTFAIQPTCICSIEQK